MNKELQISEADQRKLARQLEKMRLRQVYPLESSPDGRAASDSRGCIYMREAGKGNVRVILTDDGPVRASHKDKTIRKAELKAIRQARKNAVREQRKQRGS